MDAEPAAVSLATAPEEEGHCAPLTLIGKEVAKAQESPLLSEQPTAAQAESQAAAPHSPAAYNMALQDTDQCKMSGVLNEAVAAIQGLGQQLAEHWEPAQTMHVVMAPRPPSATQDSESSLPGKPPGEPSTASLVQEECEDGEHMASAMSGDHQGEPSTASLVQEECEDGEHMASAVSGDHQGEPSTASLVQEECEDGEHMPSAMSGEHQREPNSATLVQEECEDGEHMASAMSGELQREPNSATLVPEECEDGEHTASAMSGDHQGEPSTAIFSPAAHEEDLASLLPQISLDDAAAPHLDRAGEDETDSTWSPLSWDSWHQVSQGRVTSTEHHELLQAGAVSRPCAAGRWLVLSVSAR